MQTGRQFQGGINTPHAGAVASYLLGRRTDLPPHVVLPETMGRGGGNLPNGQAGGFLGKAYDPFALMADPSKKDFKVPDLLPPDSIGTARLDRRKRMREIVDSTIKSFETSENARQMDDNFQSAYRLMTSPEARDAFDLTKEPEAVRERYGMNRFGQCCLMARRLIEAGVRFVTINSFLTVFDEITWDIHGTKPFTSVEGMKNIVAPMYDQGYSALIEDLFQRGMLEDTMVCNLAEFGRTPKVNPAGGRDHWPQCFTVYFAGGGVQGGRAIGASDPIGAVPADRPTEPPDVVATIFHSLGLKIDSHLPGPAGRPFHWSMPDSVRFTSCSKSIALSHHPLRIPSYLSSKAKIKAHVQHDPPPTSTSICSQDLRGAGDQPRRSDEPESQCSGHRVSSEGGSGS